MATKAKKEKEVKNVLTVDVIALQKGKVLIGPDASVDNRIAVSTVQAHLMQYRHMLTQEAFEQLSKCDLSLIETFHNEAIEYLKVMMGGKTSPKPLYKNFPEEVMSKGDGELFWDSLIMYWTGKQPVSVEMEKPVEFEKVKYTMIKPIDEKGFQKIFTDLVSVNTSLTPADMGVIMWFAVTYKDNLKEMMPANIPFKENLMTLAAMGIPVPIKTTTDVLRIAVHMSGGDISLPAVPPKMKRLGKYSSSVANPDREKFKFKSFNRKERRIILGLLEQTHCNPAEMVLKDQRWIRLGEILHPGDFKEVFPKSYAAFDKIRNTKVRSWYSKLTKVLYNNLDLVGGLKILTERPGEFMRRLDWLFRTFDGKGDANTIFEYLMPVLDNASNKVLFEVYTHFEKRRVPTSGRSVFIKGARKKTPLPELKALDELLVDHIQSMIFVALRTKFSKLETLGNVWIDENLKKIPVPTNMRSMNMSLKPSVRGTRIPFDNPDAKVIRGFVHWKGPVDLDLSASFVRDKKVGKGMTSWDSTLSYSTSGLKLGNSCHSGDVLRRSGPCAEYIDIDIQDAVNRGFKYVLLSLRNFQGGPLKSHEAVFGMMEREKPESNDTWLPETITSAQQLEASGMGTYIAILDLHSKEYITLDIDSASTVERGQTKGVEDLINDFAIPPKFSVYDLLMMHVEARGKLVTLDQNVDTMFKFEDFVQSYELTGQYML